MWKKDLSGQRFGKLLVVREAGRTKVQKVLWVCLCECGGEKVIASSSIINGSIRSCGCARSEVLLGNKRGLGTKRTPASRAKTSKALIGRTFSATHCARISESRTEEFREAQSQRMSGENNPMYGKEVPGKVKEILHQAMLGNKHLLGHKHSQETRQKMSAKRKGGNHWNWKGGITADPYGTDFQNREFRTMIFERDGFKCQNPDCRGTCRGLRRHHINYDKMDCAADNLITLCQSCNMRANQNRKWHEAFYGSLVLAKNETITVSVRR